MAANLVLSGAFVGDLGRREVEQSARRLELGRHVGEGELGRLEVGDRLAELLALLGIFDRLVEAALGAAERAGADVDAPAVEAHHRDAEALALGADEVGHRHADARRKSPGAVGCECQPSFFSCAPKLTPGMSFSITRQEMPFGPSSPVRTMVDIDVVLAAARDERLRAGDDIMVAVLHRLGLERGCVGARAGLGQAVAGDLVHRRPAPGRYLSFTVGRRSGRSSRPPCCGSR